MFAYLNFTNQVKIVKFAKLYSLKKLPYKIYVQPLTIFANCLPQIYMYCVHTQYAYCHVKEYPMMRD